MRFTRFRFRFDVQIIYYIALTCISFPEELTLAESQHDQLANCYIFWVKVLSIIEESSDLSFYENVPIAMENVFYEM